MNRWFQSLQVPVYLSQPQGTVLDLLLFLLYTNDLPDDLSSNVCFFSDDCIVFRPITTPTDCDILQKDIKRSWKVGDQCLSKLTNVTSFASLGRFPRRSTPINFLATTSKQFPVTNIWVSPSFGTQTLCTYAAQRFGLLPYQIVCKVFWFTRKSTCPNPGTGASEAIWAPILPNYHKIFHTCTYICLLIQIEQTKFRMNLNGFLIWFHIFCQKSKWKGW